MPTYEYVCQQCGHEFDAVQSFTEPSLTLCPACGGSLRKKFGSVGVVFKGPGFYRTDSREKPSDKSSAKSEAGATPSGATKQEGKSTAAASKPGDGSTKPDGGATKSSSKPESKSASKPVEKPSKK